MEREAEREGETRGNKRDKKWSKIYYPKKRIILNEKLNPERQKLQIE